MEDETESDPAAPDMPLPPVDAVPEPAPAMPAPEEDAPPPARFVNVPWRAGVIVVGALLLLASRLVDSPWIWMIAGAFFAGVGYYWVRLICRLVWEWRHAADWRKGLTRLCGVTAEEILASWCGPFCVTFSLVMLHGAGIRLGAYLVLGVPAVWLAAFAETWRRSWTGVFMLQVLAAGLLWLIGVGGMMR